jgi:hypothetical protein
VRGSAAREWWWGASGSSRRGDVVGVWPGSTATASCSAFWVAVWWRRVGDGSPSPVRAGGRVEITGSRPQPSKGAPRVGVTEPTSVVRCGIFSFFKKKKRYRHRINTNCSLGCCTETENQRAIALEN